MAGYVYIVTNQKNGTLYIGVTSDIERRIYEHRQGLTPGFALKYGCSRLVWYEVHNDRHGYPAGKIAEALVSAVESGIDRGDQPGVAGPIR